LASGSPGALFFDEVRIALKKAETGSVMVQTNWDKAGILLNKCCMITLNWQLKWKPRSGRRSKKSSS
jgi:hypothetical protein